jgi:hypothetical protein
MRFSSSRDPERPRPRAERKYNSCDTFTWSIKSHKNRPIDVFFGLPCPIDSSWSSSRTRGSPRGSQAPNRTAAQRTPHLEQQNRKAHYFNASGPSFSSPSNLNEQASLCNAAGRPVVFVLHSCSFATIRCLPLWHWFVGKQREEEGDAYQAKAKRKTPQPWRIVHAMSKRSAQLFDQIDRSFALFGLFRGNFRG